MTAKLLPETTDSVYYTLARTVQDPGPGQSWLYVDMREDFHFADVAQAVDECAKRNTKGFKDHPFFVVEVKKKTTIKKVKL